MIDLAQINFLYYMQLGSAVVEYFPLYTFVFYRIIISMQYAEKCKQYFTGLLLSVVCQMKSLHEMAIL